MKRRNQRHGALWFLGEDSGASQGFSNVGKRYWKGAERTFLVLYKSEQRRAEVVTSLLIYWLSLVALLTSRVVREKLTPRLMCHLLLITSCFCWSCALSKVLCTSRCWDKRVFPQPHCTRLAGLTWEPSDNIHSKLKAFLIQPPRRWLAFLLTLTVILISFEDSFISPKKNPNKD